MKNFLRNLLHILIFIGTSSTLIHGILDGYVDTFPNYMGNLCLSFPIYILAFFIGIHVAFIYIKWLRN